MARITKLSIDGEEFDVGSDDEAAEILDMRWVSPLCYICGDELPVVHVTDGIIRMCPYCFEERKG